MKKIVFSTEKDMPPLAQARAGIEYNKTGLWSDFLPVYNNKLSPCNPACPVGNDVRGFVNQIAHKNFKAAYEILTSTNPFPSICGRVCYHPCETACNRKFFDAEVGINALERFIGDWGLENIKSTSAQILPDSQEVAIIGSGPAGLACAYHLARRGISVDIFEALKKPGGMMRIGIPEYRLPEEILDRELEKIWNLGVRLHLNKRVGRDISWSELKKFKAIFISSGAFGSRNLGVKGEEEALNIVSGLEFLQKVNFGEKFDWRGKQVLVVGGGDTSIDAARCALRLGAKVTLLYRRTIEEMRAFKEEVKEALNEGVQIDEMAVIKSLRMKDKKVYAVECVRLKRESSRKDGSFKAIPIPDSEFVIPCDFILAAIGQFPEMEFISEEVKKESWGIQTGAFGGTNLPNVFAGGDVTQEIRAVSNALGSGRRAALSIEIFLKNRVLSENPVSEIQVKYEDLKPQYFIPGPKQVSTELTVEKRIKDFKEIKAGLEEEKAVLEADRCFSCGNCNLCDNCYLFCPDLAISKKSDGYTVNSYYCKGCAICSQECPRGVIDMVYKLDLEPKG